MSDEYSNISLRFLRSFVMCLMKSERLEPLPIYRLRPHTLKEISVKLKELTVNLYDQLLFLGKCPALVFPTNLVKLRLLIIYEG